MQVDSIGILKISPAFLTSKKRNGKYRLLPSGDKHFARSGGIGSDSSSATVKEFRVKLIARSSLGSEMSSSSRDGRLVPFGCDHCPSVCQSKMGPTSTS